MNLEETFFNYVSGVIDEKGIYPAPMIVMKQDDSLEIVALAISPYEAFDAFWTKVTTEQPKEVIFGLDRSTKEGQGTEFADVLTVIHWTDSENWATSFRIGALNYQHEPRIVRKIDWNNEFWKTAMTREAASRRPPFRIRHGSHNHSAGT